MSKIRVLVVEDSLTIRKRLIETLSSDQQLEVVGEAADGREGIELCQRLRPDVITLDMILPVMNGLAATEYIMAHCPTPILIVSSSINRGELFKTYEALAAGAVDVLEKPQGDEPDGQWERRLLTTVRIVSRIKVITHPRGKLAALSRARELPGPPPLASAPALATSPPQRRQVIAIGASTGGPGAVLEILRGLPHDFPIPILLVIHIGHPFGSAMAEWLDGRSPLRVSLAKDGEALPPPGRSRVLMAPPDQHLVVRHGRLWLSGDPERHSCRPSVDVLFESLAQEQGEHSVGCLLTGMGRDGAAGLLALRQAGGLTLAQDEASSVVFGMPREAILLGAAQRVLSLEQFSPALIALAAGLDSQGRIA